MRKHIYILVLFFWIGCVDATVFGDKPWCLRDRDYNVAQDLCVMSPCRTGSTLMYNLLRLLFDTPERHCIKTHDLFFGIEKYKIFVCVRNPLDSGYSWCRVHENQDDIESIADMLINQFEISAYLLDHCDAILLRYEEDQSDLPVLISKVEQFLDVTISEHDRKFVQDLLLKESVLTFLQQAGYKDFSQYDLIDHIHGNHIATESNDLFSEYRVRIHEQLRRRFVKKKELFLRFGYDMSCIVHERNPK